MGKTSPPYKYKGPRPIEYHPIDQIHLLFIVLSLLSSLCLSFSNLQLAILPSSPRHPKRSRWPADPRATLRGYVHQLRRDSSRADVCRSTANLSRHPGPTALHRRSNRPLAEKLQRAFSACLLISEKGVNN
jgi:hypothetical protein